MTTKTEILRWYCRQCPSRNVGCEHAVVTNCDGGRELSALIDSLVKSCPRHEKLKVNTIGYWDGYMAHCDEVEKWEREVLK